MPVYQFQHSCIFNFGRFQLNYHIQGCFCTITLSHKLLPNSFQLALSFSVSIPKVSHHSGATRPLAGAAGLEPTTRESKSRVLPLHHAPIYIYKTGTTIIERNIKYRPSHWVPLNLIINEQRQSVFVRHYLPNTTAYLNSCSVA